MSNEIDFKTLPHNVLRLLREKSDTIAARDSEIKRLREALLMPCDCNFGRRETRMGHFSGCRQLAALSPTEAEAGEAGRAEHDAAILRYLLARAEAELGALKAKAEKEFVSVVKLDAENAALKAKLKKAKQRMRRWVESDLEVMKNSGHITTLFGVPIGQFARFLDAITMLSPRARARKSWIG